MTEALPLFKALHIYGAIIWIGGIAVVSMAALLFSPGTEKEGAGALRSAAQKLVTPGMLLAWVGGLAQLFALISAVDGYMKQGWLHGKLLLVLIAAGLTGAATAKLRKVAAGELELGESKLRGFGFAILTLGLLVVVLAVFKPGLR